MADYTYDGAFEAPASGKVASMANWAGAAVSLALVAGIGIWGYRVMARDVSGIPVVQAMSGPMREAPVDPGGRLADHQGLAVNAVAGQGAAARPADRLVLAPRAAGLGSEDVAVGALAPQPDPRPAVAPMETALADRAELAANTAPEQSETGEPDSMAALIDQIAGNSRPLTPLEPGEDTEVVASVGESSPEESAVALQPLTAPQPLPESGKGLARSLKPRLRPAGLSSTVVASVTPAAAAEAVAAAEAQVTEIAPTDLATGTRLVQIGAFDSMETARDEWDRLANRFGEFLDDKARVVQKASSGGRTFYRLRAHGFEDLADARRFCAAFVAQNVDCIPVVTR